MARPRNPKRDQAFHLWKESNGTRLLKDIAEELECSPTLIRKWKNQDSWDEKLNGNVTKRPGAPKGSKNARGNKGVKRHLVIKMLKAIGVAQLLKGIRIHSKPVNDHV